MPANDIFELSIDAVYNGQNVTNVMHFIQIGVDGSGDARDALIGMWQTHFDTPQRATQVTSVTHFQDRARRLFPTQTQTIIASNAGLGTHSGNGLPTNQCGIIRMYGVLSGRKGVGNQKLYGVGTDLQLAGRLSVAWRDLVQPYADLFIQDNSHISGYKFHAGVLGIDNVLRQILVVQPMGRVKTVHSRSIGVGG